MRKLATHPQKYRVSFQRSGALPPPYGGGGRQTHYVCVGPRFWEQCVGQIAYRTNPRGWTLTIDRVQNARYTFPVYEEEFATLRAAKESARAYIAQHDAS